MIDIMNTPVANVNNYQHISLDLRALPDRKHQNDMAKSSDSASCRPGSLQNLIDNNLLTTHFQPIISLQNRKSFAYEALCRTIGINPFNTIEELFAEASRQDMTLQLDMQCRQNAIQRAAQLGLKNKDVKLFINICPSSILHPGHNPGTTEKYVELSGLTKEQIVLEITEREAVHNYSRFRKAIDHYRNDGFSIAIDDFGAGYGGLKMLSMLEPDYVKIDRHFFKEHSKGNINYNLIDAIATACHRIGIEVIGEGIELENDLKVCRELGIDLLQGYYFAHPSAHLCADDNLNLPEIPDQHAYGTKLFDEVICVGDIARYEEPMAIENRVIEVLNRLQASPRLHCLPVHDRGRLCGLINRQRFMETNIVGRLGYGMNLNYYKSVADVLEASYLDVPHYFSVEEVARKIHLRQQVSIYDDVCVTRSGKYMGVVAVSDILNAVTQNSMMLARGANPLTGLPGNEFIQRQVAKMLSQSIHFDVCYIDIDNFKPFNDRHGFEVGDRAIKGLGDILTASVKKLESSALGFAGHIGGDDFIVISRPKNSILICNHIIAEFEKMRQILHSRQECVDEFYMSVDRQGDEKKFGLLSLSIGIVSTEVHHISSFAEISSIATDLKKRAKKATGSAIIRDRRAPEKL